MRRVMVRVLPVPAPASTQTGPRGASTAARCSGSRPCSGLCWACAAVTVTAPSSQPGPTSWGGTGRARRRNWPGVSPANRVNWRVKAGLVVEPAGHGHVGEGAVGVGEQRAGAVDAGAQHELRGGEPEHRAHPTLEHRRREPGRRGHLVHARPLEA